MAVAIWDPSDLALRANGIPSRIETRYAQRPHVRGNAIKDFSIVQFWRHEFTSTGKKHSLFGNPMPSVPTGEHK
jgi:hypothetical protein